MKHRTYNDYYRVYLRALKHRVFREGLATRLHSLAHDAAKQHSAQQFYDSYILAALDQ